jgi:hypothetical protein
VLWRKLKLDWRYAIGEFSIVLLGVLAALAVDSWNSDRKDRILEGEYVDSMIADLELDHASIRDAMEFAEYVAGNGRRVLRAIEDRQINGSPEEFARSVNLTGYLRYPTYSRATINDLMATGNLRLLRSEAVRNGIAAYYATIDWNAQWNQNSRNVQTRMNLVTTALLDVEDRELLYFEQTGGPPWAPESLDVSEEEAGSILNGLIERPDAKGLISYLVREQGALHTRLTRIREELLQLSQELHEYRKQHTN